MYFEFRGDRIPFVNYKTGMPVYIRFGRWERVSHNSQTLQVEAGVSVYRAKARPIAFLPDTGSALAALTDKPCDSLRGQGRIIFPVTGREVGMGSDGEPVLRAVKMLSGIALDLASIPQEVRK